MSREQLVPTAQLFARILLREIDVELLQQLEQPDVAAALQEVGIRVPDASELDDLAAQYFETLLHPHTAAPPIASLWTSGEYEGDAARSIRELAKHAGLEFDAEPARGAAPDHLGCILLLWSEASVHAPEVAERIQQEHLAWVPRALAHAGSTDGFYGQVARATVELVERIGES